jgi:hypothetical protein
MVLLEYKSNMFRADAKYGGDHLELATEIQKKLVQDKESGSRKGVWQLSEAVKTLFGPNAPNNVIPGINIANIKNVYLYLITLDSKGELWECLRFWAHLSTNNWIEGYIRQFRFRHSSGQTSKR